MEILRARLSFIRPFTNFTFDVVPPNDAAPIADITQLGPRLRRRTNRLPAVGSQDFHELLLMGRLFFGWLPQ